MTQHHTFPDPQEPMPQPRVGRRGFLAGAAGAAGAIGLGAVAQQGSRAGTSPMIRPAGIPARDVNQLDLLQRMLHFDTQNFGHGGKTRRHAEMLKAVWDRAGVPTQIIPTPTPDNVHLIARIPGTTSAKPVLMLGHSDVVPVERENWSVDPFGGVVKDGQVWGRGALDMKGANAAFITALLRHLREGHRFDRDIIVLTDCDEEAGDYGSSWLAEHHWDKIDAGAVLTEGGWFLAQPDQQTPMLISVTRQDKVYFNLDLVATGTATHSSKPIPDAAVVRLSRAVDELASMTAPVRLTPVTRTYFRALAEATRNDQFRRAIEMMLDARTEAVQQRAADLMVKLSSFPYLHRALTRTTTAFVIEEAGYKENVIPSEATCRVNCRGIPGGQQPRAFLYDVRKRLEGKGIEVKLATYDGLTEEQVLAELDAKWATPPADLDNDLYRAIEASASETYPQAVFTPALFEAGTSLSPWRTKGIPGYGVYPYVINNAQLIGMHGNDERIFVDALAQGTEFMYRVFDRFRA